MLDIFDMEDAPKPAESTTQHFANDIVGRLKGGYQVDGVPVASETIVMTTDDPTVAAELSERFGGEVEELDVDRGDDHRLVSEATSVDLIVDSPKAFVARFAMYGQGGLIFATDGKTILDGESFAGEQPGDEWSGRPGSIEAWKTQAKNGRAPKPDIRITGKLAANPELGKFVYKTTGWSLVRSVPAIEKELAEAFEKSGGAPVSVTLTFDPVEIKKGPNKGRRYTSPRLTVNGPVEAAE